MPTSYPQVYPTGYPSGYGVTTQQFGQLHHQMGIQQHMVAEQSGIHHVDRSHFPRPSRRVEITVNKTPHPDAIPITPYISIGRYPIPTPGPAPTAVMSRGVNPGLYPDGHRNTFIDRSLESKKHDSAVLDKALKDILGDAKDQEPKDTCSHVERVRICHESRAHNTTPVNHSGGPTENVPLKFRTIYDAETQMLVVKVLGGGVKLKGFRIEYVDGDELEKDEDGYEEKKDKGKGKEVKHEHEHEHGPKLEWDGCEMWGTDAKFVILS